MLFQDISESSLDGGRDKIAASYHTQTHTHPTTTTTRYSTQQPPRHSTVRIKHTRSRGTPRVTFLLDTPAKWNVFRVICVAGSPQDCAAIDPICRRQGTTAAHVLSAEGPGTSGLKEVFLPLRHGQAAAAANGP